MADSMGLIIVNWLAAVSRPNCVCFHNTHSLIRATSEWQYACLACRCHVVRINDNLPSPQVSFQSLPRQSRTRPASPAQRQARRLCVFALILLRFQVNTRGRFGPHALNTVIVLVLHRLPRMRFHNPRQAETAIRLWIKAAKEDVLEIPQPRGRLVLADDSLGRRPSGLNADRVSGAGGCRE
jgi:hypothetical protein